MKTLLIIANCPSENTARLLRSVAEGARNGAGGEINVLSLTPEKVDAEMVLSADAVVLGSTENFGAMAGLVKDFFERIYYPCLEKTQGLPVAVYVRAGNDGAGTIAGIQRILTGLRWRLVQEPLLLQGEYQTDFEAKCYELGEAMAAGVELGIF